MTNVLTSAQMRANEAAAIQSGHVTGHTLMERAGRGVVEAVLEEWPELQDAPHRAVVLCGPGNNGGDGFVVARMLRDRGWDVRALAATAPEVMPPDAACNAKRWLEAGSVAPLTCETLRSLPVSDLYVDAIFGTGLSRAPEGEIARLLASFGGGRAGLGRRVVAIDAPSGLCLDSGRSLISGAEMRPVAQLTVTFDSLKAGHVLDVGPDQCGRVVVKDIGISPWRQMTSPVQRVERWSGVCKPVKLGMVEPAGIQPGTIPDPGALEIAKLSKRGWCLGNSTHKFSFGHALVLSGGISTGGAARLAARGALRIGAGLVSLGCPPGAVMANAAQLNAIMIKSVAGPAGLKDVLDDARINALCLGPGLGLSDERKQMVRIAVQSGRQIVLDADALTLLAQDAALFKMLHQGCILTPHAGEFTRLFPDIAEKLAAPATKGPAYSKVDATRAAALRAGCAVLFKGAATVIADPSGRCSINSAQYDRAAPWLATAGSGDVLAGFIAGLLARGYAPVQAAEAGAWLHVECARAFGPGLIAEDLPEELPAVFRALGL